MKALALLSGGLDSTLAIKVVIDQGIEVEAINFFTPFCLCGGRKRCGFFAKQVSDRFGVRLQVFNLSKEYLEMILKPKYGYGKNLNPCIDCRILMHRKAREYMEKSGASFVITGEVLGQRPMSQHKDALKIIEKESGLDGFVLRPLSAKLLPPSEPEKKGWIDRRRLLEIRGRSRKPQMALAEEYRIDDFPCPAGGCLLTDPGFSRRMKDLITYSEVTLHEVELLKIGRHFRLSPSSKVIIGRNEDENKKLSRLVKEGDILFEPVEGVKGPTGIGRGKFSQEDIKKGAGLIARYSDIHQHEMMVVKIERFKEGKAQLIQVCDIPGTLVESIRV